MVPWLILVLACHDDAAPAPSASPPSAPPSAPAQPEPPQPTAASPLQADMLARPLDITRHGACRMDCRKVDLDEVQAVLRDGSLDPARTRDNGACPSHAIEGVGSDGHRLRVVFAECRGETRLVTAIDLDQDWPCDCD